MSKLMLGLIFSGSFLVTSIVFAQNSGQSSSDGGVLVSPSVNTGNSNTGSSTSNPSNKSNQVSKKITEIDPWDSGKQHWRPSKALVEACQGKTQGDACEVTTSRGTRPGLCAYTSDKKYLFCRHNRKRTRQHPTQPKQGVS